MAEEGGGSSCSKNSKNRGKQLVFSHGENHAGRKREEKEEIQKLRAAHQIRGNARLKSLLGLRYESPFASRKTHARPKRAGQSAKSIIFSKWILGKEEIASNYALVSRRICRGKSSKLPYGKNTDGRTWKKFSETGRGIIHPEERERD